MILPGLNDREKDALLFEETPPLLVDDMGEGVEVVEILRRLNEGDARIAKETEQPVEDVRKRYVVRIELKNELAVRLAQRVVEVARFRVLVGGTGDVPDAEFLREGPNALALAVIEQVRYGADTEYPAPRRPCGAESPAVRRTS